MSSHLEVLREMLADPDNAGLPDCAAALDAAIAALSAAPVWVSVDDRLPADEDYGGNELVLVRYRYADTPGRPWEVGLSYHDETGTYNRGWMFGSCKYAEVSHWMPMDALLALAAAPSPQQPAEPQQDGGAVDYVAIANRAQEITGRSVWPSTVKAVLEATPQPAARRVTEQDVERACVAVYGEAVWAALTPGHKAEARKCARLHLESFANGGA